MRLRLCICFNKAILSYLIFNTIIKQPTLIRLLQYHDYCCSLLICQGESIYQSKLAETVITSQRHKARVRTITSQLLLLLLMRYVLILIYYVPAPYAEALSNDAV